MSDEDRRVRDLRWMKTEQGAFVVGWDVERREAEIEWPLRAMEYLAKRGSR